MGGSVLGRLMQAGRLRSMARGTRALHGTFSTLHGRLRARMFDAGGTPALHGTFSTRHGRLQKRAPRMVLAEILVDLSYAACSCTS